VEPISSGTPWAVWLIVVPMAAAMGAFLVRPRAAAVLGLATGVVVLLLASAVGVQVWEHGPQRHLVGGWGAPLGIELAADGLSALMLLMTAAVGLGASVYAYSYLADPHTEDEPRARRSFWPLWLFLWSSLNALFLSSDVFNLYVTLELVLLGSVALIALARDVVAIVAGLRYLLLALVGSLAYLLGVAFLYAAFGTLDLRLLGAAMSPVPAAWVAIALMSLGLILKAALFPLHFWLPAAHANALTPVSAILSGLVVKAAFYLLLRLWFDVFPEALTPVAAQLLGALGAAAILWGSILALRQARLKLLVAYSTVAQIGYLFLLFPLAFAAAGGLSPWSGGVYHALSHAAAKAAMFMAAGNLMIACGHDQITGLRGCGARLPVSLFAFGLAGVSLMGLPPSGGFVAKWLLLQGAIETEQWWFASVIVLGGLLAAAYIFPVLRQGLAHAATDTPVARVPATMELVPLVLALAATGLGILALLPLELLQIGAPFPPSDVP
jgi:multicomponent Na+:H+ antiporter subunit D